ncbi:hypothetical protein D3C86_796370 [compost metagenome]
MVIGRVAEGDDGAGVRVESRHAVGDCGLLDVVDQSVGENDSQVVTDIGAGIEGVAVAGAGAAVAGGIDGLDQQAGAAADEGDAAGAPVMGGIIGHRIYPGGATIGGNLDDLAAVQGASVSTAQGLGFDVGDEVASDATVIAQCSHRGHCGGSIINRCETQDGRSGDRRASTVGNHKRKIHQAIAIQRRGEGPTAVWGGRDRAVSRVDADTLHTQTLTDIHVAGIGQQLCGCDRIDRIFRATGQTDRATDRWCIVDRSDIDTQGIGIVRERRAVADLEADAGIAAAIAIGGRHELQFAGV